MATTWVIPEQLAIRTLAAPAIAIIGVGNARSGTQLVVCIPRKGARTIIGQVARGIVHDASVRQLVAGIDRHAQLLISAAGAGLLGSTLIEISPTIVRISLTPAIAARRC